MKYHSAACTIRDETVEITVSFIDNSNELHYMVFTNWEHALPLLLDLSCVIAAARELSENMPKTTMENYTTG